MVAMAERRNRKIAEKVRAQREAARRRKRRNWLIGSGATAVAAAGIVIAIMLATSSPGQATAAAVPSRSLGAVSTLGQLEAAPAAGTMGPEGVPVPAAAALAGVAASTTGQAIDGVGCQTSEQTLFHIHAHLTIFVNGKQRQVPAGIGIPGAQATSTANGPLITSGSCFYWLHTHAADGIIHIESPVQRTYTLGDFFDEWGQPLSQDRVGPATGHVTALYNGKVYLGDPRGIPLTAHAQIQLEVGTPLVAQQTISFAGTGL
jgi:hypothetical protein